MRALRECWNFFVVACLLLGRWRLARDISICLKKKCNETARSRHLFAKNDPKKKTASHETQWERDISFRHQVRCCCCCCKKPPVYS